VNLGLAKVLDRVLGNLLGGVLGAMDGLREIVRTPVPMDEVRHILLVKFWGLGNWALLRPVVADVRLRYPGAKVSIATLSGNAPLAQDLADEMLLVRTDGIVRTVRDLLVAVRRLRRAPPDLALDFEQFARSGALLARLGRARQRIGFRTGSCARDGLFTATVPFRDDLHAACSFRHVAEAGGLAPGPYVPGGLAPTAAGRAAAAPFVRGGPFVVLHPGSGDNFPGRRWSVAGFAAVGRKAGACGRRVLVTGGVGEIDLAARTAGAVGPEAVSLAGRLPLEGLIALLAEADALVSNDTGPVHLASSLGVPVLALYGPNTPTLYGPLSPGSRAFYRALPCSPCITVANYRSSRCRIPTCMASIAVGEVVQHLGRVLTDVATTSRVGL